MLMLIVVMLMLLVIMLNVNVAVVDCPAHLPTFSGRIREPGRVLHFQAANHPGYPNQAEQG